MHPRLLSWLTNDQLLTFILALCIACICANTVHFLEIFPSVESAVLGINILNYFYALAILGMSSM